MMVSIKESSSPSDNLELGMLEHKKYPSLIGLQSQASSAAEDGQFSSSSVPATSVSRDAEFVDDEELQKCQEYLKTVSGYRTYLEVLERYGGIESEYWAFVKYLRDYSHEEDGGDCEILDTLWTGNMSPSNKMWWGANDQAKAGSLLKVLNTSMDGVDVRLILISITSGGLPPWLIDIIGLKLAVEPGFFLESTSKLLKLESDHRPLNSKHYASGSFTVKIIDGSWSQLRKQKIIIFISKLQKCSAFYLGIEASEISEHQQIAQRPWALPMYATWPEVYKVLLAHPSFNKEVFSPEKEPIHFLYPLMQLQTWQLLSMTTGIHKNLIEIEEASVPARTDMHIRWGLLRRMVEDHADSNIRFRRLATSRSATKCFKGPAYKRLFTERDHVYFEARRRELELRDFLQLQVGKLSLEESKKSIEMSNVAIEEGKRGLCHRLEEITAAFLLTCHSQNRYR